MPFIDKQRETGNTSLKCGELVFLTYQNREDNLTNAIYLDESTRYPLTTTTGGYTAKNFGLFTSANNVGVYSPANQSTPTVVVSKSYVTANTGGVTFTIDSNIASMEFDNTAYLSVRDDGTTRNVTVRIQSSTGNSSLFTGTTSGTGEDENLTWNPKVNSTDVTVTGNPDWKNIEQITVTLDENVDAAFLGTTNNPLGVVGTVLSLPICCATSMELEETIDTFERLCGQEVVEEVANKYTATLSVETTSQSYIQSSIVRATIPKRVKGYSLKTLTGLESVVAETVGTKEYGSLSVGTGLDIKALLVEQDSILQQVNSLGLVEGSFAHYDSAAGKLYFDKSYVGKTVKVKYFEYTDLTQVGNRGLVVNYAGYMSATLFDLQNKGEAIERAFPNITLKSQTSAAGDQDTQTLEFSVGKSNGVYYYEQTA